MRRLWNLLCLILLATAGLSHAAPRWLPERAPKNTRPRPVQPLHDARDDRVRRPLSVDRCLSAHVLEDCTGYQCVKRECAAGEYCVAPSAFAGAAPIAQAQCIKSDDEDYGACASETSRHVQVFIGKHVAHLIETCPEGTSQCRNGQCVAVSAGAAACTDGDATPFAPLQAWVQSGAGSAPLGLLQYSAVELDTGEKITDRCKQDGSAFLYEQTCDGAVRKEVGVNCAAIQKGAICTNGRCDIDLSKLPDQDQDLVPDVLDNCKTTKNIDQYDADADGVGDVCDNCKAVSNMTQADGDGDSVGDVCDNCATLANPEQTDANNDKIGDVCKPICPEPAATILTADEITPGDADHDGVIDSCVFPRPIVPTENKQFNAPSLVSVSRDGHFLLVVDAFTESTGRLFLYNPFSDVMLPTGITVTAGSADAHVMNDDGSFLLYTKTFDTSSQLILFDRATQQHQAVATAVGDSPSITPFCFFKDTVLIGASGLRLEFPSGVQVSTDTMVQLNVTTGAFAKQAFQPAWNGCSRDYAVLMDDGFIMLDNEPITRLYVATGVTQSYTPNWQPVGPPYTYSWSDSVYSDDLRYGLTSYVAYPAKLGLPPVKWWKFGGPGVDATPPTGSFDPEKEYWFNGELSGDGRYIFSRYANVTDEPPNILTGDVSIRAVDISTGVPTVLDKKKYSIDYHKMSRDGRFVFSNTMVDLNYLWTPPAP